MSIWVSGMNNHKHYGKKTKYGSGPIYDNVKKTWRRKYNKELQGEMEMASVVNYIRGQRIQWLGLIWRCNEDDFNKIVLKWKPTEKDPEYDQEKDG